jgi:CheY-like chemotaxis protein
MDFSMPVMNGLDAARELKKLMPTVPIILFTLHGDYVRGASGIVDRVVSKMASGSLMGHVRELAPPAKS